MNRSIVLLAALCMLALPGPAARAANFNAFGLKLYSVQTPHFRVHYSEGLGHLVKPVADKLESLYSIFTARYRLKDPGTVDVFLNEGDESNGFAFANLNMIHLWIHDFDYNLRGSHDWLDDVITHEYAHIVSIRSGLKLPPSIPYIEFGYFSYINQNKRIEALHIAPTDIFPIWFAEGIAQHSSSTNGSDSWDSHRDMILRTLTLSGRLLSWDHIQQFAGKSDDFEKTYNAGFSLVSYISDHYGPDKIVALAHESAKLPHANFDGVVKKVLGISGSDLYRDWKASLTARYEKQLASLGPLRAGRKINEDGFENYWPRFSPDGKKIYFLSNGKKDYRFRNLYSYALTDSVDKNKKIKPEMAVRSFYDIQRDSRRIAFCSPHSRKSMLPANRGGVPTLDLYIDTLPPEKTSFSFFPRKTERQLTRRQGIFCAAFSPSGDELAVVKRRYDRFYLAVTDTSGKKFRIVYPDSGAGDLPIYYIYSLGWSPDGKRIAFSYFDAGERKIGVYDTLAKTVSVVCNTSADERDPAWSRDGASLYFASDRTGIFNIYRYDFASSRLARLTNVRGGAFAPAVSPDGKRLAYAGYDSAGYGIYLLDTLRPLSDTVIDSALAVRATYAAAGPAALPMTYPSPKPFEHFPRQFMLVPALIAEQLVATETNVFSGKAAFKAGVIVNLFDPAAWIGMGTELGAFFFFEPQNILDFVNFDHGGIDIERSYDAGLFGSTRRLPVTLSFDYIIRGIAGKDQFYNETEDTTDVMPYNVRVQNLNLLATRDFGLGDPIQNTEEGLSAHLLAGLTRFDVSLKPPDFPVFVYNLDKSYRAGGMATYFARAIDSRSSISPRGIAAKLQYTCKRLFSLNEENSLEIVDGFLKENQNLFVFHEGLGHLKCGISAPWYGKHDLHFELLGDAIRMARRDTAAFPSFNLPAAWVPGYAYYERREKLNSHDKKVPYDTLLVTGTAVVSGAVSYRFPLSPALIDKRLWIVYLEKLYGCLNVSGGAGFTHPSQLLETNRADWLVSYGAELRLQASTFGGLPLAVKLRWDRGIDRPAPLGGDRFAFGVGFDFDDWDLIMRPDYRVPTIALR